MQYLKENGYPKIGKLITSKGDVTVYTYGAHKVLRLFFGDKERIAQDLDLATHLISNPVKDIGRIYSASVITVGGRKCLAVIMRKYVVGRGGGNVSNLYNKYGTEITTKQFTHEPYWDVHSGNIGYYSKDKTKTTVVFDIWRGIGGSRSPVYKERYLISKRKRRLLLKYKREILDFLISRNVDTDYYYDCYDYLYCNDRELFNKFKEMTRYGIQLS